MIGYDGADPDYIGSRWLSQREGCRDSLARFLGVNETEVIWSKWKEHRGRKDELEFLPNQAMVFHHPQRICGPLRTTSGQLLFN